MGVCTFFLCSYPYPDKPAIEKCADFLLSPCRYLKEADFKKRPCYKTALAIALFIPAFILGILPKLISFVFESVRGNFRANRGPPLPLIETLIDLSVGDKNLSIDLHAEKILKFYQSALTDPNDQAAQRLKKQYHAYPGALFQGADFLVRHGSMHVSFVALMVPVILSFYRDLGDQRAKNICLEEVIALQIAALFHDFGRAHKKMDLCRDSSILEAIGAKTCYDYLVSCGFKEALAEKMKQAIMGKEETDLKNKDLYADILHECDCLAVLRADDWTFDPKFLHSFQRLKETPNALFLEKLYEIIDEAKLLLIALGDSPKNCPPLSKRYQAKGEMLEGSFSLSKKREFETSPDCFKKMETELLKYSNLALFYPYSSSVSESSNPLAKESYVSPSPIFTSA